MTNAGRQPPNVERQPEHQRRCDRRADRGSAVEERHGPCALAARKPFRHGFGRARPVAGFADAEREPRDAEASEAASKRRQHACQRVPRHGQCQTPASAYAIHDSASDRLHQCVGDAERDQHQREVLVRPVELAFQHWRQHAQRLAIEVVDDSGERRGVRQSTSDSAGGAARRQGHVASRLLPALEWQPNLRRARASPRRRLEAEADAKLHLAHVAGRADRAEGRRGVKVRARVAVVHEVEDVRDLRAELHRVSLAHAEVAIQPKIDVVIARPLENVAACGAV